MLIFMYFIIVVTKKQKADPDFDLCVVKEGVNHPITVTELTDVTTLTHVGHQLQLIMVIGFCL